MAETEVAILGKKSTFDALVAASDLKADGANVDPFFNEATMHGMAEARRKINDEVPFSQMWRTILAAPNAKTGDIADALFGEAVVNGDKLLSTAAAQLAQHYPDEVMSARIDMGIEMEPGENFRNLNSSLAWFLHDLRTAHELDTHFPDETPVISHDWMGFANLVAARNPAKHEQVFLDAVRAGETSEDRSVKGLIRAVAPVLARHFPQVVVTHLETSKRQEMPVAA